MKGGFLVEFIAILIVLIVFLSPFFAIWWLVRFIKKKNNKLSKNKPHYVTKPEIKNSADYQQNYFSNTQQKLDNEINQFLNTDFNVNSNANCILNFNEFENEDYSDYQMTPYRARRLLTNHELEFYRVLKDIAKEKNLCILSKIRLADLVEVEPMSDKRVSYGFFNKISRKHIDFALAKPDDLSIVVLIELDDFTHDKKQSDRDKFVEAVFKKTQYKLLRVRSTKDLKNRLEEILM